MLRQGWQFDSKVSLLSENEYVMLAVQPEPLGDWAPRKIVFAHRGLPVNRYHTSN